MAGDWLKVRHDVPDDPAVIRIAAACQLDEDAVLGKLFRLWSWADRHTQDGHAEGVGLAWVDRTARHQGFAVEMVRVGWLEETGSGLKFPRFDRHCSESAKARALKKNRMERCRGAARATKAPPEKRREELPPPPPACAVEPGIPEPGAWDTLREAWQKGPGVPWTHPEPPDEAVTRLSEPGWLAAALTAIGRLGACHYFQTPVGLPQFCGPRFVRRVNEGRYDEVSQARKRPVVANDRPSAAEAAQAWAKSAADPDAARRRAEFLSAKRRRSAGSLDGETESARAAAMRALEAVQ